MAVQSKFSHKLDECIRQLTIQNQKGLPKLNQGSEEEDFQLSKFQDNTQHMQSLNPLLDERINDIQVAQCGASFD